MKIIGHRGAAGLALENTLPSIELAKLLGVNAIEFDVRKTADNKLVICHDADLEKIAGQNIKIRNLTLKQLQNIKLKDNQSYVPTLQECLKMAGNTPVIIEIKEANLTDQLLSIVNKFKDLDITIASFKLDELAKIRKQNNTIKLYGLERTKPYDILHYAKELGLNGVGLNFWILNPLTYFMAKKYKLDIYVYTVNGRLLGKFIGFLYPMVSVCTDHPEWFISHPYLKIRSANIWPVAKERKRNI